MRNAWQHVNEEVWEFGKCQESVRLWKLGVFSLA